MKVKQVLDESVVKAVRAWVSAVDAAGNVMSCIEIEGGWSIMRWGRELCVSAAIATIIIHPPHTPKPHTPLPSQIVDLGFDENFYWDNIKLGLMVVACAFAMVAQFYPMPFPESRPLLGVCCVSYFLASTIIQLIVSYVEQDAILTTQPHEVNTC